MKKSSRVISTLLLGATLTTFSTGVFAVESQKVVKEKLAGATRYETNLAVSAKWEKAETVILVEGYAIPDALAATPLAKQKDAPILLTETAKLTKATADEITRLGAKNAIIVGGEGVVSKEVEKDLEAMNVKVTRLAGQSRFETSEAVVKEMGEVSKVAVVNGYGESDALSIAAPAAKDGMAIVLAGKDELKGSADVVKNAKEKYVIGGEGVVSEKLQKEIGAERLGGATRNETNAAILDKFYSEKEIENLYVAKDGNPKTTELVDALGVGPLAGKEGNPVMLAGAKASAGQLEYLKDKTAKKVTEVGNGINATTLADIVKALEVKDVTPEPDKAEVTGVEVLNASQIEVKFSQKVDKDTAETIENYTVKLDGDSKDDLLSTKIYGASDVAVAKADVQEDGKTVVITLPQRYGKKFYNQETLRVKVQDIMNEDKSEVFEKYDNRNVKLFDNTLPKLKEIKQVGPKEFDVVFSEPVTVESYSDINTAIKINNGSYSFNAETRVENKDLDANVIRIKTSSELKEGEYKFTITDNKIMDYAGLKIEDVDTKLNVKKDETALTASVYKVSGDEVTLKFNKEIDKDTVIDNDNVKYYLDYGKNTDFEAKEVAMENGKVKLTFKHEVPSGDHKIVIVYDDENEDKVQDLWEQELSTKEISFTVAKDTIAPTASVEYNKNDETIEVKFSKEVKKEDAVNPANYELKDANGKYKDAIFTQKKNNKLVYEMSAKGLSGKYTLKIKGDKIHDTSVERNALKEATFELNTLDQDPAILTTVRYGGKNNDKVYVEFSEDMKTSGEGSILDKSLYHLNYKEKENDKEIKDINKNLNDIEDAKIALSGNNAVIITLPNEIKEFTSIQVGRVCDENGNFAELGGTTDKEINGFNYGVKEEDTAVNPLNGSALDEEDILDKTYAANVISDNEVEIFLKGRYTAANPELITVDGKPCKNAEVEQVKLKIAEGKSVWATKLKLEVNFADGEAKLPVKFEKDSKKININNVVFKANSLTTILDTKIDKELAPMNFVANDKATADYADDNSATIITKDKKATKVTFKLTEGLKNNSINKTTFDVDGYVVKNAVVSEAGEVTLSLDEERICNPDTVGGNKVNIKVTSKEAIWDTNDNKTKAGDISFSIKNLKTQEEIDAENEAKAQKAVDEEAAKITTIEAPEKDATKLTLPTVEGYTVAIKSSDKIDVIAMNGTITPPTDETDVKLTLTLTNVESKKTADTVEITVKVPAKTPVDSTAPTATVDGSSTAKLLKLNVSEKATIEIIPGSDTTVADAVAGENQITSTVGATDGQKIKFTLKDAANNEKTYIATFTSGAWTIA